MGKKRNPNNAKYAKANAKALEARFKAVDFAFTNTSLPRLAKELEGRIVKHVEEDLNTEGWEDDTGNLRASIGAASYSTKGTLMSLTTPNVFTYPRSRRYPDKREYENGRDLLMQAISQTSMNAEKNTKMVTKVFVASGYANDVDDWTDWKTGLRWLETLKRDVEDIVERTWDESKADIANEVIREANGRFKKRK